MKILGLIGIRKMDFTTFWKTFEHPRPPRGRGNKITCQAIWDGRKRTEAKRFVTPADHERIMEASEIHRDNMAALDRDERPMCSTWMNQERWETILEARDAVIEEEEQRKANIDEDEKTRRDILDFNRAFQAWKHANPRGPFEPKHTRAEYDAYVANRPKLRVVERDD